MKAEPREYQVVKDEDFEYILGRLEEEFAASQIKNEMAIDTSVATVEQALAEFVTKFDDFMTLADRGRIALHFYCRAGMRGGDIMPDIFKKMYPFEKNHRHQMGAAGRRSLRGYLRIGRPFQHYRQPAAAGAQPQAGRRRVRVEQHGRLPGAQLQGVGPV